MHRIFSVPVMTLIILLLCLFFLKLAIKRTPAAMERKEQLLEEFRENNRQAVEEYERGGR